MELRPAELEFLDLNTKIEMSIKVIQKFAKVAGSTPLVTSFSGGKDSMTLLSLAEMANVNHIVFYTDSGFTLPTSLAFVKKVCKKLGYKLFISKPDESIYQIVERRGYFPTTQAQFCSTYCKFKPMHETLSKIYGEQPFYKLSGVRMYESNRRRKIYAKYIDEYIRKDHEVRKDWLIFPILHWRNDDVTEFLDRNKIKLFSNPEYKKFGVQGCFYCPFYHVQTYINIMEEYPNIYDRFIELEQKVNKPAIQNRFYLRDLKAIVTETREPEPDPTYEQTRLSD